VKPRACILKSLWAGGVLTFLLLIAVILWTLLAALGDNLATAMKAIALLVTVCWTSNLVVLVILCAWAQVSGSAEEDAAAKKKTKDG